jgi:hypothetical protein
MCALTYAAPILQHVFKFEAKLDAFLILSN